MVGEIMKVKFNKLIPELSVSDINKSKEFYLSLGFSIIYERVDDKFCFLELDGNQLMIEEVNENWNVGELEYPFGRDSVDYGSPERNRKDTTPIPAI